MADQTPAPAAPAATTPASTSGVPAKPAKVYPIVPIGAPEGYKNPAAGKPTERLWSFYIKSDDGKKFFLFLIKCYCYLYCYFVSFTLFVSCVKCLKYRLTYGLCPIFQCWSLKHKSTKLLSSIDISLSLSLFL